MKNSKNILDKAEAKENPFTVPDGYFSDFADRVENACKKDNTARFGKSIAPLLAMAASFAAIAVCGAALIKWSLKNYNNEVDENNNTSNYLSQDAGGQNISEEDIINYLIYCGISSEEIKSIEENE